MPPTLDWLKQLTCQTQNINKSMSNMSSMSRQNNLSYQNTGVLPNTNSSRTPSFPGFRAPASTLASHCTTREPGCLEESDHAKRVGGINHPAGKRQITCTIKSLVAGIQVFGVARLGVKWIAGGDGDGHCTYFA